MTEETRAERQQARIKSIALPKQLRKRIKAIADANSMSNSEAARRALAAYESGEVDIPPLADPTMTRLSVWFEEPEDYAAAAKKARDEGVPLWRAIEAGLEVL